MTVTSPEESLRTALAAAEGAEDKLATDVVILHVGPVVGVAEYFVLATAGNDRQVKAVVDAVEQRVAHDIGEKPRSVEGADARRWVLLDYGDVVVHVFLAEERDYYRLERLYADAPVVERG
ncbi:ribosome silencing factor [Dermatobacter hominis]|uniref:ribosome silencing factor n=1 Tax=Dermatobacter hominis TaxID=2884263 RepID=UPI001D117E6F|nr:ribosome silencing factor [Dermatobacter hominis]UDY35755.1 ribosome silencing factor [Dermatobacter hominis]